MNKKYLKLALIGLAAGFCLSGQASPANNQTQEEIAMAKCSKDGNGNGTGRMRSCPSNNNGGCGTDDCNTGTCKPKKNAANQKKSAAQKVVQGS